MINLILVTILILCLVPLVAEFCRITVMTEFEITEEFMEEFYTKVQSQIDEVVSTLKYRREPLQKTASVNSGTYFVIMRIEQILNAENEPVESGVYKVGDLVWQEVFDTTI